MSGEQDNRRSDVEPGWQVDEPIPVYVTEDGVWIVFDDDEDEADDV